VDVHGNLGTHAGVGVRATAQGEDVYATADAALEKIEKQLRRYKRRITNHHRPNGHAASRGVKYVLPSDFAEQDEAEEENISVPAGVVIAEKAADIETLTVSGAVMRMDLQDLPALMFRNYGSKRLNVVYRRADGNISWVNPQE
jgi:hypothetical protein